MCLQYTRKYSCWKKDCNQREQEWWHPTCRYTKKDCTNNELCPKYRSVECHAEHPCPFHIYEEHADVESLPSSRKSTPVSLGTLTLHHTSYKVPPSSISGLPSGAASAVATNEHSSVAATRESQPESGSALSLPRKKTGEPSASRLVICDTRGSSAPGQKRTS
jgi:hypothetical protein